MKNAKIKLPRNANIVELSYEPGIHLRARSVELPRSLTPGEVSRQADIVFTGVHDLEISLDLGTNPCVSRVSKWGARARGARGSKARLSIKTTMGYINVACDSVQQLRLRDIPVMAQS